MKTTRLLGLLTLCALASIARAELWLGQFDTTLGGSQIRIYPETATGNLPAVNFLGGPNVGVAGCNYLRLDPISDEVVCSDFSGQAIAVFSVRATGNVFPLRRMTSTTGIGQVRAAIRLGQRAEIASLRAFNNGIRILSNTANGQVTPTRSVVGGNTQIDNPSGLSYLPQSDEMAIGDSFGEPGAAAGELLIFSASANGNVAPDRRVTSSEFGVQLADVLYVSERPNELFLLVGDAQVGSGFPYRIVVIPRNADGVTTPLRQISGGLTLMNNGGRLAYLAATDEIVVSTGLFSATPRVVAFPAGGNGNLMPTRTLTGDQVGGPFYGIESVSINQVFRDGFE